MNFLRLKIKEHKLAIFFALLVGFIYFLPYLYFNIFSSNFAGFQLQALDSEVHYLARLNEVSEGHLNHASTFLYEYKNSPYTLLQYSEIFYGLIISLFDISIGNFFLAVKFIFPVINFLLLYYLSYLLFKSKKWAVIYPLFFLLAYSLKDNLGLLNLWNIFSWNKSGGDFLMYSRVVNPSLTYPFFFSSLIVLFLFFKERKLKYAIIFGLLLGLSFYVYYYFWVYLCVIAGLVFLYFLVRKKFEVLKKFFIGLSLAGIVGAYYVFSMFKIAFGHDYDNSTEGALAVFESSHQVIISKVMLSFFLIFVLYLFYKYKKREELSDSEIFVFLALVSTFIVVNQQVITGRLVEEGHFHWYTNLPMAILAFVFVLKYLFEKIQSEKIRKSIYYFLIIFFLFYGLGVQVVAYRDKHKIFEDKQRYMSVFDWLRENSRKESVVFANGPISNNVAVYTHNNSYYAEYAKHYATTPLKRRINAFYLYYFLENNGIMCDNIDTKERNQLLLDWVYFKYIRGGKTEVPEEIIDKVEDACLQYENKTFCGILNEYRIDYVVWDKNKNPNWAMNDFACLNEIMNKDGIYLYTLK